MWLDTSLRFILAHKYGELYTIPMANNTEMGQNTTSQMPVQNEHGYSPKYAEHISNVIGLDLPRHALDHKLRQITNCDGRGVNLICRKLWLSQFVTVQNTTSQIDINSNGGYTLKFRKHIHIKIGPFQEGRNLWSRPWRHKLSPITLKTCSEYLVE